MAGWLDKIPDGAWAAIAAVAAGILGLIGWLGKTAFDAWRKSSLPFKQDKERYDAVINAIDPAHLHYFREIPLNSIESRATDGLNDAFDAFSSIRKNRPKYLNKKLEMLEGKLFNALKDLVNFLHMKLFPHRVNTNIYTMYWDNFDEWDGDHNARFQEIKNELMQKIDRSIAAFEAFRDEGNRLFADRLVKEKSDG
jgi:hypothetical protein